MPKALHSPARVDRASDLPRVTGRRGMVLRFQRIQAIQRARETAKGTDLAAIKSAVESLDQVAQAFSKQL